MKFRISANFSGPPDASGSVGLRNGGLRRRTHHWRAFFRTVSAGFGRCRNSSAQRNGAIGKHPRRYGIRIGSKFRRCPPISRPAPSNLVLSLGFRGPIDSRYFSDPFGFASRRGIPHHRRRRRRRTVRLCGRPVFGEPFRHCRSVRILPVFQYGRTLCQPSRHAYRVFFPSGNPLTGVAFGIFRYHVAENRHAGGLVHVLGIPY